MNNTENNSPSHTEFYNETAGNPGKRFNLGLRSKLYEKYYIPKLLEWGVFEAAKDVLEVGVGSGDKLSITKKHLPENINTRGIDYSERMLEVGRSKYPELKNDLEQGDAYTLENVESESQDVMMYYQILHHFEASELKQIIDTAYDRLKVGGKLVIIDTFKLENPIRKLLFNTIEPIYAVMSARRKEGTKNYHNHPKDSFVQFIENNGFRQIHESGDKPPFFISEIVVFEKI